MKSFKPPASSTVTASRLTAFKPVSRRAQAWAKLASISPLEPNWEAELSGLMFVLVDALLAGDTSAFEAVADPLRDRLAQLQDSDEAAAEMRGWLTSMLALTRWTLQRLPSEEERTFGHNTQARNFLVHLLGRPSSSSSELRAALGTGETQVSRVGHGLRARGLVVQRRAGRSVSWELTPRGRQLANTL
jgi:DNA-binding MarR family transcriptional regulator